MLLSLHFIGHFPGEPGLAGVYWCKGWWKWLWQLELNWSSSQIVTNNKSTQTFCRPDALPVAKPTFKALKGKISHSMDLPQAHQGIFQLCIWPLIAPGYLGEGCYASYQPSDASCYLLNIYTARYLAEQCIVIGPVCLCVCVGVGLLPR